MKYKGVIFDLDGVIIDSESIHYEAYRKAFLSVDYILSKEEYNTKLKSRGRRIGIPAVIAVDDKNFNLISKKKDKYYKEAVCNGDVIIFDDAMDLILRLDGMGIPMVIGTSSKLGGEVIKTLKLEQYFQRVITSEDVAKNKPDPQIYCICKDILGYSSDEVVVIEDSLTGTIAALGAGIDVIFVNREGRFEDNQELNEELINNPKVTFCDVLNNLLVEPYIQCLME